MRIASDDEGGFSGADEAPELLAETSLAQRGGLAFFWVLNDDCDRDSLLWQLDEFQRAGTEGLILHPRNGLLLPYASDEWFDLIGWLVEECLKRGIEPILYDEDPYPSGNAGGRIVLEHPELRAREIQRFEAPAGLKGGELFLFPAGQLCWVGIVFPEGDESVPIDLSSQAGMIRQHWEKAEWNSRWYYPGTPVYSHPRAFAHVPEFGIRVPVIPPRGRLVAFVARPVEACNEWGTLVDSLNPKGTRLFLEGTHERYRARLGKQFGRGVRSIFTDEPKPHASYAWTPELFTSFQSEYGYDLRPELERLFGEGTAKEGMRVRSDYREWVVRRFNDAWMKPVAQWCREHDLSLIGHLSPEEDPVNQAATLGNVFPPQKQLFLSGYDLIIPAIGDSDHPLLNVGALMAASTAQQGEKPGVCCESLGAFGLEVPMEVIGRTLAWQVLHGATLGVIHGAFSSQLGLRRYEAPDDYGTQGRNWRSVQEVCRKLAPFFKSSVNARQEAPVAILWPIRSFQAQGALWQDADEGHRHDLLRLLMTTLEHQVGVHFLDEDDLTEATLEQGEIAIGRARYTTILLPPLEVISQKAREALGSFSVQGIKVIAIGGEPRWERTIDCDLIPLPARPWCTMTLESFEREGIKELPRVVMLPDAVRRNFHATLWNDTDGRKLLLMQMGKSDCDVVLDGSCYQVSRGELLWLREIEGRWKLADRFSPRDYHDAGETAGAVTYLEWEMQVPGRSPLKASHPLGVWQLLPTSGPHYVRMIATGEVYLGGGQMAERVVYRAWVQFSGGFDKAHLRVEPTLMRGCFTLEVAGRRWEFSVRDTDHDAQVIDLSEMVKPEEIVELLFILHQPEAMDGIKHSPAILLSSTDGAA